jgi:chaperonin GroES
MKGEVRMKVETGKITKQRFRSKDSGEDITLGPRKPKFLPLGDRILVKRLEPGEAKKGGIIIPDSAKEKPQQAKVIALGQGKLLEDGKRAPFEVKMGDKVFINKYGGTEITINDEEHLIVREDDILAIVG